jgi:hypothetical protein
VPDAVLWAALAVAVLAIAGGLAAVAREGVALARVLGRRRRDLMPLISPLVDRRLALQAAVARVRASQARVQAAGRSLAAALDTGLRLRR